LPLITTNCVILGVIELVVPEVNFGIALLKSICYALGFMLAICLLASIRESINQKEEPAISKGLPIVLVLAGLIAMAFDVFKGMIKTPSTDKLVVSETVAKPITILYAGLILLAIMLVCSLIIYLSNKLIDKNKKNSIDDEAEELLNHLPNVNCGACGNPSCREFAKRLLKGEVGVADCKILKAKGTTALEEYLKEKQKRESRN